MSAPHLPDRPELQRWDFGSAGGYLELAPLGLRLASKGRAAAVEIPYQDLTHVDTSARGLWIGTRKTARVLRRTSFHRPDDPEDIARALSVRLNSLAGGREILDRMLAVSARVRSAPGQWASAGVGVVCLIVFVMQVRVPLLMEISAFVPALVKEGELWRIVTANFFHEFSLVPIHLLINMMCLLAFGLLVERPLGATRTFVIMAIGAIGAMLGSALAGYAQVIGASGIVAALGGAVLWLELNATEYLAAWWRLPRRMFIGVLLLQAAVDFVLPQIAGGAHFGGFVAGYFAAGWVRPGAFEGRGPSLRLQQIAGLFALLTLAAFVSAGQLVLQEGAALEHHASRLLVLPGVDPVVQNDLAWQMATEYELTDTQLGLAIQLATRAVEATSYGDPDYLDTLAEVLFLAGDRNAAVDVIDQAIALNGDEPYFREQRRRFTGERAPDDRPVGPTLPWSIRKRFESRQLIPVEPGVAI